MKNEELLCRMMARGSIIACNVARDVMVRSYSSFFILHPSFKIL